MRKDWLWIGVASLLLAACSTNDQQAPISSQQPAAYNGPVVEIGGVEPRYEPVNPATSQDYSVNGKNYRIVKDPSNYSETGLASWYGEEANGTRTASGENFDPEALTAAHPTLPIPSYVRVTNIANGRQIVVRINDRGPYKPGRIIDLSRAAGDRLNISNNSKVRIDFINVAPDGTLSGPGTIGTRVAKQSYALPARPDIAGGGMTVLGTPSAPAPEMNQGESHPVDNSTLNSESDVGAPVRSSGFLGAPQPLPGGVLESNEPAPAAPAMTQPAPPAAASATTAHPAVGYVVQVGAVKDPARAQQLMNNLSQRFGVQGAVEAAGDVQRVQLGGFKTRAEAAVLQQRLKSEAQIDGFITSARHEM